MVRRAELYNAVVNKRGYSVISQWSQLRHIAALNAIGTLPLTSDSGPNLVCLHNLLLRRTYSGSSRSSTKLGLGLGQMVLGGC